MVSQCRLQVTDYGKCVLAIKNTDWGTQYDVEVAAAQVAYKHVGDSQGGKLAKVFKVVVIFTPETHLYISNGTSIVLEVELHHS